MRDRVLFGVTLTDDLSMGFQMFQTANDRGTSLTSYDMFRAFCIKHATVTLSETEKNLDKLVEELNEVEGIVSTASENDVKQIMTAWVSGRTGLHANKNRIINDIESEINSTKKLTELKRLINDLSRHAKSWEDYVGGAPSSRQDRGTPVWRKIGRIELMTNSIHKPMVMELRNSFARKHNNLVENIVSIIQWSYARDFVARAIPVAGNTHNYQIGLPKLQNFIWNWGQRYIYRKKIDGQMLNEVLLLEQRNRWMDYCSKNNPSGFDLLSKGLQFSQDDFEHHIRFLLHIVDSGMAREDPRLRSNKMNVEVKIIPKSKVACVWEVT